MSEMDEEWPKSVSAEIFSAYNKAQNELIENALEGIRNKSVVLRKTGSGSVILDCEYDMQKEG